MKCPPLKRCGSILLLFLLATPPASARADDMGFFFGLGLGDSQFRLNEANIVADYGSIGSGSRFNDGTTSFSIFGGVQFDEFLALEVDVLMAGDITARDAGRQFKLFDVGTIAFTLVMSTPVGERTRLFGRIGAHMWDLTVGGDLDSINSAVDPTYGVGADINLYGDRSRQMRIQWNHYEYDGTYIDDSGTLSVGILFKF